jgi:hypothetical protein
MVTNVHKFAEDNPIGNDILDSLRGFRGLQSVNVEDVSPSHARDIKMAMESPGVGVVEDLHAMLEALRIYLGEDNAERPDWDDITDAVGLYDVEGFKEIRRSFVAHKEATRTAAL